MDEVRRGELRNLAENYSITVARGTEEQTERAFDAIVRWVEGQTRPLEKLIEAVHTPGCPYQHKLIVANCCEGNDVFLMGSEMAELARLRQHKCRPSEGIAEALNSGDGSYKP